MVGENGSMDYVKLPKAEDRKSIRYFTDKDNFNVLMGVGRTPTPKPIHPIIGGTAQDCYEVDFYPIFNDAQLLDAEYIQWRPYDITQEVKNSMQNHIREDERNKELQSIITGHYYRRKGNIHAFVQWKHQKIKEQWSTALRDAFLNIWISMEHADFGNETWEKVHIIRESEIGKDYRRMVKRVEDAVYAALPDVKEDQDIYALVNKNFQKEIVKELKSRQASIKSTIRNIGINLLGLFPFVSFGTTAYSSGQEMYTLVKDRHSWITLLKDS